ncbi:MAG: DNA polymerase III subunit alpha, partial [Armatimonadetes bacterium]|nr:DNA polymerase III subunit alpha [Armatimonadota bacterium]
MHTVYSLLDGASRTQEVAQTAAQWDMPAVALTDHGSMFGAIEFYLACKEQGVKPIIGVESYMLAEGSRLERKRQSGRDGGKELCHFTLLAENETGYRNLLKLVSDSWLNGFYYKPRLDHELIEQHHDGLIAMSACLGGEIPQAIMNGQQEQARKTALYYRELFGANNFFLELMDHHTPEQQAVNLALVELSRETGIPLVATNDVHYVKDSDAEPQDLLLCIQTGCLHSDPNRMRMSSRELFMRNAEQMWELFGELPDALLRTREIADRCNLELKFGDFVLPEFPVPEGHTAGSYLRQVCNERVGRFYQPVTPEIRSRLDYELQVIEDKGYSAYFLIVWDLIDFAKNRGIRVGPGRGSAAGSMVAYVLGITELDPLEYALFFERFLNPERPSAPDIDIDFPPERRDEVVAYTIQKYGTSRTAKIITFGTMGAKAALKDVGRVLDMPIPQVNELTALVPDKPGTSLQQALGEVDELRRRYESDEQVHNLLEAALRLEGLTRHTSIHAAALVIARDDLTNYVPLCRVSGGEDNVTQFDMGAIDKIGLLKMDFLGLRTMTVIDEACVLVRKNHNLPEFDVHHIPLDDKKTYDLISRGEVVGVFQLESGGFQRVCRDLKPDRIEDIVALVALYRPGPMDYIPDYIDRKHGRKKVVYHHPLLEPILETTYGIIVYQEQVMQIGRDLAGFSLGEADAIRKAVGKKDAATMAKVREKFIAGCEQNGIQSKVAKQLMDDIEAFARYAFNKAHSACYAVVSYWTAYLKANYPHEFMAAQLTSVMDKRDKVISFIQDTRQMGIEVQPPCVNTGGRNFEVHEDHIVYGLGAINGIGLAVADAIVAEREHGAYADLYDLCLRVDPRQVPKAAVEKLIRAGACRAFGNRQQLLDGYEAVWEAAHRAQADAASGQGSLFGGLDDEAGADIIAPQLRSLPEFGTDELRAMDAELLGLVLFENPLGELQAQLADIELEFTATGELAELKPQTEVLLAGVLEECFAFTTRKGDDMLRARLNDGRGTASLVLFPKTYAQCASLAVQGEVVLVSGKTEAPDGRGNGLPSVIVERLYRPADWKKVKRPAGRNGVRRNGTPAPRTAFESSPLMTGAEPGPVNGNGHGAVNGNGHAPVEVADNPPVEIEPVAADYRLLEVKLQLGGELRERLRVLAETLRQHPGELPVILCLEEGPRRRRLELG